MNDNAVDGFIERKNGGKYEGRLSIEGVDLSPIEATYFKQEGKTYLWLKRKPIMEYSYETSSYTTRQRLPQWECYLTKQVENAVVAFKGECVFLKFKYSVVGIWDAVFGSDMRRLNLFVERLPMSEQTILNGINERKRKK